MVANRSQFDLPSSFSVELHDGIVVLCLSHPKKCNAIDLATLRGIEGFFRELPTAVRAVIIRVGGAHFPWALISLRPPISTGQPSFLCLVRATAFSTGSGAFIYRLSPCCAATRLATGWTSMILGVTDSDDEAEFRLHAFPNKQAPHV